MFARSTTGVVLLSAAVLGLAGLSTGCRIIFDPFYWQPVVAPQDVREAALTEALRYVGMEYEYGGDDVMPRGIDCSGLVINAYSYAAEILGYRLPFLDANVAMLLSQYTGEITNPEPGDLIFMGSASSAVIDHVGLFMYQENGEVFFVDSTSVAIDGVRGVEVRSKPVDSLVFKQYGRLVVQQRL